MFDFIKCLIDLTNVVNFFPLTSRAAAPMGPMAGNKQQLRSFSFPVSSLSLLIHLL